MKKIALLILIQSLTSIILLHAEQPIMYSYFRLINRTESITNIAVFTKFSSSGSDIPHLNGVIEDMRSDTLYFKILYKERTSAGWGSSVSRYDTFTNVALPVGVNYLHISGNRIKVNAQLEITDTSWNESDSIIILRPTSINDINKAVRNIVFFPNPAENMLSFEEGLEYRTAEVFNNVGRHVASYPKNLQNSIDISALSKGMYFIKLLGKKEEIPGWGRFVKAE